MKRIIFLSLLGLLLALAFAVPAFAGGWSVITLDALPGEVVAGEPFEVGFMVRQHGVRPMEGLTAWVHAQPAGIGKTLTFAAKEEGEMGHYVAMITLPDPGEWKWSIEAFTGNQPMPALTVVAASSVAMEKPVQAPTSAFAQWPQWLAAFLGAAGILGGLIIALRQKTRWAIALIVTGLLVGVGGVVSAADQPEVAADAKIVATDPRSQAELGHDLFIAKGCMLCHSHSETNNIRQFGVDIGPNLTNFTGSPDYIRMWLKDPLSVKSTATMPTLQLSEEEIEALIAFINDK